MMNNTPKVADSDALKNINFAQIKSVATKVRLLRKNAHRDSKTIDALQTRKLDSVSALLQDSPPVKLVQVSQEKS